MKRFIPFLLLLFIAQTDLWAAVRIHGKVMPAAEGRSVVLLEENPNKTPQGPLARVATDARGQFEIQLEVADPQSRYRIGSRVEGALIASDPFVIQGGQKEVVINLKGEGELTQGDFRVTGKVIFPLDQQSGQPQQVLLFQVKGKGQKMIMMRKSDAQGRFVFPLSEVDLRAQYFLGLRSGRVQAGTELFGFSKKKKRIQLDIKVPQVTSDTSRVKVAKMVFFFDRYEDRLEVGEVLLVDNQGGAVVDLFASPWAQRLPSGVTGFEPRRNDRMEVMYLKGQAVIKTMLPLGKSEIFLSYNLPPEAGEYLWGLLPGTQEVELVHSGSGMRLDFTGTQNQVVESKQEHQGQVFFTQKVLLPAGQSEIGVEVSGMGLPQKKLFFPATFLLIFLLTGLFWHLKIKLPKEAKTHAA